MHSLLEAAFHQSRQPQCVLGDDDLIQLANQAYLALTGLAQEQLTGQTCSLLSAEAQGPTMLKSIKDTVTRKGWWEGELQYQQPHQNFQAWVQLKRLQTMKGQALLVSFTDISERKQTEVKLQRVAYFDPLTQLPNQALLSDRLGQAQLRAKRADQLVALVLLEPDQAESLREQLGVQAFDQITQEIGQRIRDLLRAQDTLASLGQGRFALLMPDLANKAAAVTAFTQIAEKLQLALGKAMQQLQYGTSVAIGAALFPLDAETPLAQLRQAETALIQAKRKGRSQNLLFTPALQQQASARQKLALELQTAVLQSQFVLHYQPLLSTESGAILSVEALIRWQHPARGLLLPGSFLNAAEATGAMRPIGNWVLRAAVKQYLQWQQQGFDLQAINVNLSVRQFQEHYLVALVRDVLTETKIEPARLHLEINEAALLTDDAAGKLQALHELGVKLTLDDFGAGLISLRQLQNLPFDQIKIDRHFAQALPEPKAKEQLKGLATYILSLGVQVVMTGIENAMQLEVAQSLDFQAVQGFLLREPCEAAELHL